MAMCRSAAWRTCSRIWLRAAWLFGLWIAVAAQAAPGLTASYFRNMTLTAPASLVRVDTTVGFNWGNGSPASGFPSDNFSVRWTGFVRVVTTGSYRFQTNSDDGVRLWVNGTQLINNWTDHSPTLNNSVAVTLTALPPTAYFASWVRSWSLPSARVAVTTNWAASSPPLSETLVG